MHRMPDLDISLGVSVNPLTAPIIAGQVAPQGIRWRVSGVHPSELFWRQLRFGDFDVSEMSLSSLTIAASQGYRDWTALPIFTTRRFFHTGIVVRSDAGIRNPADLRSKRVGVPEYQQTAAVWTRGALQHEFGVSAPEMIWHMERPPERSHGGATSFKPPPGIELSFIPSDTNIGALLSTGELDAALVYSNDRNLVDRSRADLLSVGGLRTLFDDPIAEGIRYYRKTGILPVNHAVVVRSTLLEQHPWVALNVYAAFAESKRLAAQPLAGVIKPWLQIGAIPQSAAAALGEVDPLPFGLSGQLPVIETLGTYLLEQDLISEAVYMPGLFAPGTLDL
jgi:4,5-dihydroxyphthalate decarboxylase